MGSSAEQNQEATAATTEKPKRTRGKKQGEGEGAEAQARGPRLTQIQPVAADKLRPARAGTKIAQMIDLLAQGIFASDLKERMQRKGRALSGRINRVHGYGVHSEVKENPRNGQQEVFYLLVLPEGVSAPLAHTVAEEKPKAQPKAEGAEGTTSEGGDKPKRTRKPKNEAATAGASAEGDGSAAVGAQS